MFDKKTAVVTAGVTGVMGRCDDRSLAGIAGKHDMTDIVTSTTSSGADAQVSRFDLALGT